MKSAVKEMSQSNSSLHLGLRNPNEKKKKVWYPEWTEDMKKTNSSKYNTVSVNSNDPSSLLFTVSVLRMAFYVFKKTQTNKGMLRSDSENFASHLLIQNLFVDISWNFFKK